MGTNGVISTSEASRRQRALVVEDEPMVAEVVERYLRRDNYEVSVVHDGSLALADFARVVSNLLRNALEHTPPGGEVRISVTADKGQAIVEVAESGEGVAETDLPHLPLSRASD